MNFLFNHDSKTKCCPSLTQQMQQTSKYQTCLIYGDIYVDMFDIYLSYNFAAQTQRIETLLCATTLFVSIIEQNFALPNFISDLVQFSSLNFAIISVEKCLCHSLAVASWKSLNLLLINNHIEATLYPRSHRTHIWLILSTTKICLYICM